MHCDGNATMKGSRKEEGILGTGGIETGGVL